MKNWARQSSDFSSFKSSLLSITVWKTGRLAHSQRSYPQNIHICMHMKVWPEKEYRWDLSWQVMGPRMHECKFKKTGMADLQLACPLNEHWFLLWFLSDNAFVSPFGQAFTMTHRSRLRVESSTLICEEPHYYSQIWPREIYSYYTLSTLSDFLSNSILPYTKLIIIHSFPNIVSSLNIEHRVQKVFLATKSTQSKKTIQMM